MDALGKHSYFQRYELINILIPDDLLSELQEDSFAPPENKTELSCGNLVSVSEQTLSSHIICDFCNEPVTEV